MRALGVIACLLVAACGSSSPTSFTEPDGGDDGGTSGPPDARADGGGGGGGCDADTTADDSNCGGCGVVCTAGQHCAGGRCQASKIQHVVLIVEENHTFDAYFGRYCQAPSGSNPTCSKGPSCCERAPDTEPKGATPGVLDDNSNFANDRDHLLACEVQQIDQGAMDGYVTGSSGTMSCGSLPGGADCSSTNNWVLADQTTLGPYWSLADNGALADRYFQPLVGASSSNDMYFAVAHFEFVDNASVPNVIGKGCADWTGMCLDGTGVTYSGETTIADLLVKAGFTFAVYADGYGDAKAAAPNCPAAGSDCPYSSCLEHPIACNACVYDPSDIPFVYYAQFADTPNIKDYAELAQDISAGALPSFSFVKAREFRNEHPNVSTISDGVAFVTSTIQLIESSPFADSTLVLLTWDEGGGFFDHVPPPPGVDVDDSGNTVPYGTRVPFLALGPFARAGVVSHVQMEHSSVVRFLEYNFLGPVGQLGRNDAKVNNLGSLLDPGKTGITIPEQ
jgi:phospholipase C